MTNTQKEVRDAQRAENAPERKARKHQIVAITEGIIIGVAVVLAIGFCLGNKYANNKNADTQRQVHAAVSTAAHLK